MSSNIFNNLDMKKIISILILIGTFLNPSAKAQIIYNDVANIFYNRCTSCHHGSGPAFSLLTYADVFAVYSTIEIDLLTSHMPPWPADTAYTTSGYSEQRFLHEKTITSAESDSILQWINDGALEGNPALAPTPPVYDDTKFKLNGNASLTLQTPAFASNSSVSNTNPINCFSVPTGLTQDKWLQAFEIIPANLDAVVHVVVTIDTTGTVASDVSGNCNSHPGEIYVGSWFLGWDPVVYSNHASLKAGLRIPAGSNFIFQIDYVAGSTGLLDSTKIRLFFYPPNETGIRPIHSDVFLQYLGALGTIGPDIAAGQTITYSTTPANQFPPHAQPPLTDISLISVFPHSHNICKEVTDYAFNGTDTIPLIHIEDWTYHLYQGAYYFQKPVKIPAGYILETERLFDNTAGNDNQPSSPPVDVNFGTGPSDEIIFDMFQWLDYQVGDELLDMEALVASDTLFNVGINEFSSQTNVQSFIYPNPATDKVSIYLSKRSEYTGRIYTVTGQNVLSLGTFRDVMMIDLKNIPPGLYIIEISDIRSNERITKKIVISD